MPDAGWGPFDLRGRNALVTGGGHGIGAGIVELFAEGGAGVVVADIDEGRAREIADRTRVHASGPVHPVVMDVSDLESCKGAVDLAVRELGSIDVLVNNAGIYPFASLQDLTPQLFQQVLDVNLLGLSYMTQATTAAMLAAGTRGSIVNVASIDGIRPTFVGLYAYGASKAGVIGATAHMARELGPQGIRVNAVAPGTTMTKDPAEVADTTGGGLTEHLEAALARIPLQRFGEPRDVATVVGFLASDAAAYVTGAVIVVDGGVGVT